MSDEPATQEPGSTEPRAPSAPVFGTVCEAGPLDQEDMNLPDRPPSDALEHTPLPASWVGAGYHLGMGEYDCRLYAATVVATDEPDSLVVRYIHAEADIAKHVLFDTVERADGTVIPNRIAALTDALESGRLSSVQDTSLEELKQAGLQPFPVSFGENAFAVVDEEDAPTAAERALIWNLYPRYLYTRTKYDPSDIQFTSETA